MTVSKKAASQVWAAGGRRPGMPVARLQPGRGVALCENAPRKSRAAQIADLADSVGGVKALADALKVNRGTLAHIIAGRRPVPLKLWRNLTGADRMTEALARLEKQ